jgi:Cof subfamily protein (haloacid dehalogenase superfamily)
VLVPSLITQAPRMVVTDMDGTLLDSDGRRVSARNAAALRRAGEAGARVVIATGRPVIWLGPVIEAGFTGTAVCMNGAVTYDIGDGEIISSAPLLPTAMQALVLVLSEIADISLAVERLGTSQHDFWAEHTYSHPWVVGDYQALDRAALLAEPAGKLLIRGTSDSLTLARAAQRSAEEAGVGDQLSITYSTDDGLIEVAAAGVNKGFALARLAEQWGIDAADTIAFGDMPNDLEMLAWAGHGVAMANAHPEVTAIASEIAPHHGDDGVAAVLERWF